MKFKSMGNTAAVGSVLDVVSTVYKGLREMGVHQEDARYILPGGSTTNLVVTMNGRSLRHFFDQRLTKHAQWEIRELAKRMLEEVRKVTEVMFEDYDIEQSIR
jgi:thymidylate synthase (FAD)